MESEPCTECGDGWTARHKLPLENDPRGDERVTFMHGMGRHCVVFRENNE